MDKVRFGIVGIGNQGTYYAKLLRDGKVEKGEVAAVCDVSENKIEAAKKLLADVKNVLYFNDYKKMVDSGACDAVLVETPHYLHPEITAYCLQKGVHVLCDKPAGVYTKQVREMNEVAEKSDAKFAMMFNQRTNCVYRKMKEIVSGGGIGALQRVTWKITDWYRTQFYYDSGSWRATWRGEGGGVLINQCPHQLDLVQWIVGELPVAVHAFCQYGKWHDIEVEDEVTAYLEYADGATGVFVTTTGETPGTNRLEISGTLGTLVCEHGKTLSYFRNKTDGAAFSLSSPEGFAKPACERTEVETDGQNPQHVGILNNFANALCGEEQLFVDGKEGINGVELMNAMELSGWRGGARVTLPVNEEEYLAELNRHRAVSRFKEERDVVADTSGSFGNEK